ncbi:MAG TPA: DUF3224 domain-containing protein [Dehalococcoidia bacterium]|nr:DUF3224 domain-containing protein [Dehalococcoidia bacterium]
MTAVAGQIAHARLTLTAAEQRPFAAADGGPRLSSASFAIRYEGDLAGAGVLEELRIDFADGSASIYGIERASGSVGGRTGSFVLEHVGACRNGVLTSKRTVVPGSGTGELSGLRGVIDLACADSAACAISFHYCFD